MPPPSSLPYPRPPLSPQTTRTEKLRLAVMDKVAEVDDKREAADDRRDEIKVRVNPLLRLLLPVLLVLLLLLLLLLLRLLLLLLLPLRWTTRERRPTTGATISRGA